MATPGTSTTEARMREVGDATFTAWNDHDVDRILEYLTDDIVWKDPSLATPLHGKEAVAADLKDTFAAFPDMRFDEGDFHMFCDTELGLCLVTWTLTATMTGSFETTGLPATGKPVKASGVLVNRFRDGLVSEYTNHFDSLDFMQQLGLLPKSDGMAFKGLVLADVLAVKAEPLVERARKAIRR
jgi:steroid delta-isomerase-like uncharacterized protein